MESNAADTIATVIALGHPVDTAVGAPVHLGWIRDTDSGKEPPTLAAVAGDISVAYQYMIAEAFAIEDEKEGGGGDDDVSDPADLLEYARFTFEAARDNSMNRDASGANIVTLADLMDLFRNDFNYWTDSLIVQGDGLATARLPESWQQLHEQAGLNAIPGTTVRLLERFSEEGERYRYPVVAAADDMTVLRVSYLTHKYHFLSHRPYGMHPEDVALSLPILSDDEVGIADEAELSEHFTSLAKGLRNIINYNEIPSVEFSIEEHIIAPPILPDLGLDDEMKISDLIKLIEWSSNNSG